MGALEVREEAAAIPGTGKVGGCGAAACGVEILLPLPQTGRAVTVATEYSARLRPRTRHTASKCAKKHGQGVLREYFVCGETVLSDGSGQRRRRWELWFTGGSQWQRETGKRNGREKRNEVVLH